MFYYKKERIKKLKNRHSTNKEDLGEEQQNKSEEKEAKESYEIEIEVESEKTGKEQFEEGLQEIAKYLVDEITQISVNKVKIDALNETLNKKYFSRDLLTKHEILTSLINEPSDKTLPESAAVASEPISQPAPTTNMISKNREQLFDYYTNLEKNLESVRAEIDQLKQEAFEDLAYINEILVADDPEAPLDTLAHSEEELKLSKEFDMQISILDEKNSQLEHNLQTLKQKQSTENINTEVDEDDETEYLSQQTNPHSVDSSQVYLTPAESWQTLKNIETEKDSTITQDIPCPALNGDETDIDEEESDHNEHDETSVTLTIDPKEPSMRVDYECIPIPAFKQLALSNAPNINHSVKITNLVKQSLLSRPTVPAPPVPVSRNVPTPPITVNQSRNYENVEPQVKPRLTQSLEKKSLDKFIKLASCNSASLLDLNQKNNEQTKPLTNQIQSLAIQKKSNSNNNLIEEPATRNCTEKQIADVFIQQDNQEKDQFRIPSSRHFCGRLLSNKLSSSSSSTCDNSSSETSSAESSSITSSSAVISTNQKVHHSSDEADEADSEGNSDCEHAPVVVISSSSLSTSSSTSPKVKEMPLSNRNLNVSKPLPTQRRSVSSSQQPQQQKPSQRNTVRFIEHNNQENLTTAKSQHNIAYESQHRQQYEPVQFSYSDENLLEPHNNTNNKMKKSQTMAINNNSSNKESSHYARESPYKNMSLAKSVDHLLASFTNTKDSAPPLQIPNYNNNNNCYQQSNKDLNNMLACNAKQMTLSKSIKDLRLFVSNSFSPSLIIRPPPSDHVSQFLSRIKINPLMYRLSFK